MFSAADEEQLASDVLERLDDLYDQLIGVRQLERHLRAASVALRGASWASILNAAVSALTEISTQGVGESERSTLALIVTDDLRRWVGALPNRPS